MGPRERGLEVRADQAGVGADFQQRAGGPRLRDVGELGRRRDHGGTDASGIADGIQGSAGGRGREGRKPLHAPQSDCKTQHGNREPWPVMPRGFDHQASSGRVCRNLIHRRRFRQSLLNGRCIPLD